MRTRFRKLQEVVAEWVRRQPRGGVFTADQCARDLGMSPNAVQYHIERNKEVLRPDPERREYRRERAATKP